MSIQYSDTPGRIIATNENGLILGVFDPDKYESLREWRVAMYNLYSDRDWKVTSAGTVGTVDNLHSDREERK